MLLNNIMILNNLNIIYWKMKLKIKITLYSMNLFQKSKIEKTIIPKITNMNIKTKIKTKNIQLIKIHILIHNHKNYRYYHNNNNISNNHYYKYYKINNFNLNQNKPHNKIIKQMITNLILKYSNNNNYNNRIQIQTIKPHQVLSQPKKSPYAIQACGLNKLSSAMINL